MGQTNSQDELSPVRWLRWLKALAEQAWRPGLNPCLETTEGAGGALRKSEKIENKIGPGQVTAL